MDNQDKCPDSPLDAAQCLLNAHGMPLDPAAFERISEHVRAIAEVSESLSLVSETDLSRLEEHVADSLGLLPYIAPEDRAYIDLGSGAGFPGLIVASAMPELPVRLVERGLRKAEFLRSMVERLALTQVQVVCANFPGPEATLGNAVLTARAVERPVQIHTAIRAGLDSGGVFLCQRESPAVEFGRLFHVEQIRDAWTEAGLRRSRLWRIVRK